MASTSKLPHKTSNRLLTLDALRGFIIITMALDHANKFIAHSDFGLEIWAGQFADYDGNGLAFLARLITHLSAPEFFFLIGVGMILFTLSRREKGWTEWQIARHFAVRGSLLIALQLLIENPAWDIGSSSAWTYWGVLYALGGSMILGITLLRLKPRFIIPISIMLIALTELSLPTQGTAFNPAQPEYLRLWLIPGFTPGMFVLYPIMPWLGVLGLGIAFGHWVKRNREQALQATLPIGIIALVAFAIIRLIDGFGNIRPIIGDDWIGFFNVVKYPPAITFLLLTLGINMILLRLFWQIESKLTRLLKTLAIFGRVPLFFYLLHLYLYSYMAHLLDLNTSIIGMYPYWLLGLVILFPLCLFYGNFKHNRPPNSLWRFL